MAWNDPGGRDPWGGGGNNNNSAPPDLDEAFRKLKEKLQGAFGGSGGGGKSGGSGGTGSNLPIFVGLGVLVLVWAWQGLYVLDEQEAGVVLRFGEYHSTLAPGLNWQPPIIDTVFVEVVTEERQYTPSANQIAMLTRDGNIVEVPITVQYNIRDIRDYYLNIRDPDLTLEQATDSAIRHVVGSANLDNVISAGRELLRREVEVRLQSYLDSYGSGIHIIDVTLQEARPPEVVKEAFDDVIAAAQDRERLINQAQAYRSQVLPQSRGTAQRVIENAEAYRGELVARAQGETSRFDQLLREYRLSPAVLRERLYIDAIESVFSSTSKVLIDVEGGNNLLYLPLDRLGSGASSGGGADGQATREIVRETLDQLRNIGTTTPPATTVRPLR